MMISTAAKRITRPDIESAFRRKLGESYEHKTERMDSSSRIFADLHADEPYGRGYVLEVIDETTAELGIREDVLLDVQPPHDYTLGYVIDKFAKAAKRQGIFLD